MLYRDLALLAVFLRRVFAEVPNAEKDLVQIANAQSVVVGNYFYTVGGYTTFNVPDRFPLGTKDPIWGRTRVTSSNDHLRRIDLTRPFTVSRLDTVQEESIPFSEEVPRMRFGTMWAHNTTIYLGPSDLEAFPLLRNGIWTNKTRRVPTSGIWTYNTANLNAGWTRLSDLGHNSTFYPVTAGSVAYSDGTAYIMGGTYSLNTTLKNPDGTLMTPGLAEVQKVGLDSLFRLDMKTNVGTNETTEMGPVNSGRMVFIKSAGKNGILVYLGGLYFTGFNDMSEVRVYDIASSTWMIQKATSRGRYSPQNRKDFCAVAMSAQDYSSHQIYFYGGYSYFETSSPLDDLWVLTLPSFQFIKVGNSIEAARASGTCGVISPQYLLAYRGEPGMGSERADILGNASLALLDLTDLKWKTEYTPANASTVYRVPQRVIELIGGDETGNATTTAPTQGFEYESLAAVFNISDSKRPTSSSLASPSPLVPIDTGSTRESPDMTPPKNPVVIGISIACIAAALLSIAGIMILYRHRQRNKLHALMKELRPNPWERREADGNMVAPLKYELGGSRPVVHEIGGG